RGAAELGVHPDEHIAFVIAPLAGVASEIGLARALLSDAPGAWAPRSRSLSRARGPFPETRVSERAARPRRRVHPSDRTCRYGRLLRVGRAARSARLAGAAGHRRCRSEGAWRGLGSVLRGAPLRRPLGDADLPRSQALPARRLPPGGH